MVRELRSALAAARCAVQLAASASGDAVVRELLRAAADLLDGAGAAARRLPG